MRRLCLCGVFAAVLLSGCHQDISGTYLVSDKNGVFELQLVRTPDNRLTGQCSSSTLKPDGRIASNSTPLTGAVDGENVTLTASGFFGLQTSTLFGTLQGSRLTLTGFGTEPTPVVLKRSSLTDYQAQVAALNARSQSVIAARAAAQSRQRTEQAEKDFVVQIDQLIAKMQTFDSEADVHLGRFPLVEKDYQAITAKINRYVEQERHLAGNSDAAITRGQLDVDANQASIDTNMLHIDVQSLQSTFEMDVKPTADEALTFGQRCQAPLVLDNLTLPEVQAHRAACDRVLNAYTPFRQKYNALSEGLVHLEHVYTQERNTQQGLLQSAQRLE